MISFKSLVSPPTRETLQIEYDKLHNYEYFLMYLVVKQNTNIYVFLSGVFSSSVINMFTGLISYKIESLAHFVFFLLAIVTAVGLSFCFWGFTIRTIVIQDNAAKDLITKSKTREWSYNDTVSDFFKSLPFFRRTFWGSIIFAALTIVMIVLCVIVNNTHAGSCILME